MEADNEIDVTMGDLSVQRSKKQSFLYIYFLFLGQKRRLRQVKILEILSVLTIFRVSFLERICSCVRRQINPIRLPLSLPGSFALCTDTPSSLFRKKIHTL